MLFKDLRNIMTEASGKEAKEISKQNADGVRSTAFEFTNEIVSVLEKQLPEWYNIGSVQGKQYIATIELDTHIEKDNNGNNKVVQDTELVFKKKDGSTEKLDPEKFIQTVQTLVISATGNSEFNKLYDMQGPEEIGPGLFNIFIVPKEA